MKTFLKVVAGIVAFLVIVVVAAVIILPLVINPNDYKPQIEHFVQAKTGRQLKIPGKIQLSVFPRLGLDIGSARLDNPPGFGSKPFAQIGEIHVRVKLWPLIHKKIEVDRVELDGLQVHLLRKADGKSNWQGLVGSKKSSAAKYAPKRTPKGQAGEKQNGGGQLQALQVSSLQIRDAVFTYRDAAKGGNYKLQNGNLTIKNLRPDAPFPLKLSFRLVTSQPAVTADVELSGKVTAAPGRSRYSVSPLKITVNASGKGVPDGSQTVHIKAGAGADLKAQTAHIKNLVLKAAGVTAKADVNVKHLQNKPAISGQLQVAKFNPRDVFKRLGMQAPKTRDPKALSRFSLSGRFSGGTDAIDLSDLQLQLDQSKLTGKASVTGLKHPHIRFDLALNRMQLGRYMIQGNKKAGSEHAGAGKSAHKVDADINSIQVPVGLIKPLNLNGTLKVGSLSALHLNFKNARLKVKAKNGVLTIQPLSAAAYDGRVHLTSTIHATGKRPTYALSINLDSIHASPLLQDLIGRKFLGGSGTLSLKLTSAGITVGAIRRNLNGELHVRLADGSIHGFNLSRMIDQAWKKLGNKASGSAGEKAVTHFQALDFRALVRDGTLRSRHLAAHSKWFDLGGAGGADLVSNKLDYVARATLTGDLPGHANAKLTKLLHGVTIPIHFHGSLLSPRVNVDMEKVIQQALLGKAQRRVDSKLEKQKKKLHKKVEDKKQELRDKAAKGLQQLLGH